MIQYEYFKLSDGQARKLLPSKRFDRKTFDPFKSETDRAILKVLRTPGRSRYFHLRDHDWHWPSPSLRYLYNGLRAGDNAGEEYIDFGCGESADRFIAHRLGYNSTGMDLFPPIFVEQETKSPAFVAGDIAEPLPFADFTFTYATCHAVIALLKPDERANFYREVFRCLKIGGTFVLNGLELKNGYGFDLGDEKERLLHSTDFEYVRSIGYGVVVEKN